ncbi:sensor histidine kinase [Oceanospirillum sediminis]|uniref:histidine kinase n=1 Tax=Oceanospirillum sediminis TaxID=2760088 RepID=A0A839IRB6_9GAMM|nr:ATP-binding protein [Oceanospirillum sediminis]MBB1487845.1 histidine kinase [Oceanospirillum sediminis]
MSLFARFKLFCQQNPLGIRLLTAILICSSAITLVATGTQLWIDYRYEVSAIDERLRQIENSSLKSLSNSLWEISPAQVQVQLDGLIQLPDVRYLSISSQYGDAYAAGKKPIHGPLLHRYYELTHTNHKGEEVPVGDLTLIISLDDVYRRLGDKVLLILASQGIKTFLVSVFILSIFHHLVTRHLSTMAGYARRLKLDQLESSLILSRSERRDDELSDVVSAMNSMRESIQTDVRKREEAERSLAQMNQQLEQLNSDLESRVEQRTRQLAERGRELESRGLLLEERSRQLEERTLELEMRNHDLEDALIRLKSAQQQLVESEKMAALGELVAGVAHEINTPIGIGFTSATFLADQARQATQKNPEDRFASLTLESSELIGQHLERAAQLVRAFKQVSVDQSSEQRRKFDLICYLDEILLSLRPGLKTCQPEINISGPDSLWLDSYPGSFYQIFSNLILNSVIHGFEHQSGGRIDIQVSLIDATDITSAEQSPQWLEIEYKDNGKGIPEGWETRLFEPFITSKRNQGCSGLGMHISYNLVHQLLQGSIQCQPSEQGVFFRIKVPACCE